MLSSAQAEWILASLEQAGYPAYLVGGCVRDALLDQPTYDYDITTAAKPEETQAVFRDVKQDPVGIRHGTVRLCLPGGVAEVTTFRTEGGYDDSRHPGWVEFVPDVQTDLARRDFTINAIAWSPVRGYADPFGGQEDLRRRILRCVGEPNRRFQEDALRILRGIRFAARFRLTVEEATMQAMTANAPLVQRLSGERIFQELTGFLAAAEQEDLLRFAPILTAAIPELAPTLGFLQHSPHHAYDVYTHICHVTAATPAMPSLLRWAALLHDIGKPPYLALDETGRGHFKGHAQVGAQMAEEILTRLHAPKGLREDAVWLIDHHMTPLPPEETQLRRYLSRYGCQRLLYLIALERADAMSKGVPEEAPGQELDTVREIVLRLNSTEHRLTLPALAVDGNDMKALGYSGREIGAALNELLEKVLDGALENCRESLMAYAEKGRRQHV